MQRVLIVTSTPFYSDVSTMKTVSFLTLCSIFAKLFLLKAICATSQNGCPNMSSKWIDLGGDFCYLIERNHNVTWMDAVYNCFSEGGSLASFHSTEEVMRVVQHIDHERRRYYIGLWKHYDGSLDWVDKTALDFRNWHPGEPNLDFEKCVEMYPDSGMWNDVDCGIEIGYICASPKSSLDWVDKTALDFRNWHPGEPNFEHLGPVSGESRKVCPSNSLDWIDYGGKVCYIIEMENKATWPDALRRCTEAGGSLASFHSIEEISIVLHYTKQYEDNLHIGFRRNEYGVYKWADGSTVDLDYWKSGEPTDPENTCVEFSSRSGEWQDAQCEKVSSYICSSLKDFCGGDIRADSGAIYSPKMLTSYGPNEDCTWTIRVSKGHRVALQIKQIDMEQSNLCIYDFVEVLDGDEPGSPILGRFCGTSAPDVIRSSSNKMAIKFVTDWTGHASGFFANFAKVGICGEPIVVAGKGIIQSPNYPNKYRQGEECVWRITLPENQTVALTILNFNVEYEINCDADYVEILDGHEMTNPVLEKFCGSFEFARVVSTRNKMTVVFRSDLSIEKTGFLAGFQDGNCGGDIFSDGGNITSPNYPRNYYDNERCTWKITVPENHQVILQFQSFRLQTSLGCTSDFVEIRDGHEPGSPLLGNLCGQGTEEIIRSTTNKMAVIFVSDNVIREKGFSATFQKGGACGKHIFAEKGTIQSPNFPHNYGPGQKCVWSITVPENYKVSFKFLTFDLEFNDRCEDSVEIYDGRNSRSSLLGRYCGAFFPESIVSTGNEMTVEFTSDLFGEKTGFSAEFEADVCGGDVSSETGIISSPNYPDDYRRNENCIWKITLPERQRVVLQFQSFDLESGNCIFDFVEVRDGHESDSPILGKFCGVDLPDVIHSSSNKVTVTFVSDTSFQRKGFTATFGTDATYDRLRAELRKLPIEVLNRTLSKTREETIAKVEMSLI